MNIKLMSTLIFILAMLAMSDSSITFAETYQLSDADGSEKIATLEASYRRTFAKGIAKGDTGFFDCADVQLSSFLLRFKKSVYLIWRTSNDAARKNSNGITPVVISFDRKGYIVSAQLLASSGERSFDEEVIRTLKEVGAVGPFPKGYNKDAFHLVAFFVYNGAQKTLR